VCAPRAGGWDRAAVQALAALHMFFLRLPLDRLCCLAVRCYVLGYAKATWHAIPHRTMATRGAATCSAPIPRTQTLNHTTMLLKLLCRAVVCCLPGGLGAPPPQAELPRWLLRYTELCECLYQASRFVLCCAACQVASEQRRHKLSYHLQPQIH
jgi:hypothetical protein